MCRYSNPLLQNIAAAEEPLFPNRRFYLRHDHGDTADLPSRHDKGRLRRHRK